MKKALSVFLALFMCMVLFTACGDDKKSDEAVEYSGILTKVKLGMPLSKITALQPDNVELYYDDDTTIWCLNTDTDVAQDITALIPADDQYYYTGDSFIIYYFKTQKGDDEIYLKGYTEELHCLMDRVTAEEYFTSKTEQLVKKHCVAEGQSAHGTMTGTEGIDMDLIYSQSISASSYDITFSMTLSYDTVNGEEGYYAKKFELSLIEKEVKDSVNIPNEK